MVMLKLAQDESSIITALLCHSALISRPGVSPGWGGPAVDRRVIQSRGLPELPIYHHLLIPWGADLAAGESERKPGTFVRYKKLSNTITTCPPGAGRSLIQNSQPDTSRAVGAVNERD